MDPEVETLLKACVAGDQDAARRFADRYFPLIQSAGRGAGLDASACDDLQQQLFQQLFVADKTQSRKITRYHGRGAFSSWLRVVAARAAIEVSRRARRDRPYGEQRVSVRIADTVDTEVQFAVRNHGPAFKAAFEQAIEELDAHSQTVLRYQLLEGLRLNEIAEIEGVHASTMTRRLATIRRQLLTRTYELLATDYGINLSQAPDVVQMVKSRVGLSLTRILKTPDPPEP